jgi:hypothetical protein
VKSASSTGNTQSNRLPETPPNDVTGGLDWARDDHAVAVVDARGREVVRHSVGHSAAGLRELISVLRGSGCGEVAVERPDGPVVDALLEAGLTVVVISPNQVKNLRARTDRGAAHQTRTTNSIPVSIPPEALMRVRLIRPGNMAQAIASRLSTLRTFASEVVPALRDAAAVERGHRRTGESP